MASVRQKVRVIEIVILVLFACFFSSLGYICNADDTAPETSSDQSVTAIEGPDSISRNSDRGNFYLRDYGITSESPLKYESADESVVSVTEDGYVELHSAGRTEITVTSDEPAAVKKINVDIIKTERKTLGVRYCSNYEGDLSSGEVLELKYSQVFYTENSAFKRAHLILDDSSINATINSREDFASIDSNGVITFDTSILSEARQISANFEIITEETDLFKQTPFTLNITLVRNEREMYFIESEITANLSDGGCRPELFSQPDDTVRYFSDDKSIATIDDSGYVTFHKAGRVLISARAPYTREYDEKIVFTEIVIRDDSASSDNPPADIIYIPEGLIADFTTPDGKVDRWDNSGGNTGYRVHIPEGSKVRLSVADDYKYASKCVFTVTNEDKNIEISDNTFTMPSGRNVRVSYQLFYKIIVDLTGNNIPDGTAVTINGTTVKKGKSEAILVESGKTVTVSAVVSKDYELCVVNTEAGREITMDDNSFEMPASSVRILIELKQNSGSTSTDVTTPASPTKQSTTKAPTTTKVTTVRKVKTTAKKTVYTRSAVKKLAKSLKRPKLKCSRKKRRNKLSWSKVKGASGYELYVKYPGSKKYVRALRKSSKIKSVTHKGLTKGKVYRYKIRPYVKRGKYIAYGKFSKVVKARVK